MLKGDCVGNEHVIMRPSDVDICTVKFVVIRFFGSLSLKTISSLSLVVVIGIVFMDTAAESPSIYRDFSPGGGDSISVIAVNNHITL